MKIHIVQKGDTLWKLAKHYNVNFEELKAVNSQLTNPDLIMPGMKIKIPTGGVPIKKETHKHHYVHKEQPMVHKEKPVVSPPPIKEMPQMPPPPVPQQVPQMPPPMPQQPMTQQQMQAIDMNFNFYKPQMPPPPMVMPQMKKEVPKKVKKEKPIIKEKPTTTKPKEQPVLDEQVPVPPPTMMPIMPISQPCYPEPYYPISPVMPGCANTMIMPYYPQPTMYMSQPMYPMMPQMIMPYNPTTYYQPMMEIPQGVGQYQMPVGQMGYAEQLPQPMRMYQTPDQFEEDDDFDDDY